MNNAAVVCKQLGCGAAVSIHHNAHFGPGSGQIWLGYVSCRGTESALWECHKFEEGERYCDHSLVPGVTCSAHIKLQLVGGHSDCSGRVEISDGELWATVCDEHFDLKAASVICTELQCGTVLSVRGGAHFGEGRGPVWTEAFQCEGTESHHAYCPRVSHGSQTCSHRNDAGIICSWLTGLRLVNGSTACSGRVEIEVRGAWGTLCGSRWDLSDANVLCRQLDCGFAVSVPGGGRFGKGTGPVWADTFHCEGSEPYLGHCPVTALGASPCSHDNDAGVVCSGPQHRPTTNSGRVMVPVVVCIVLGTLLCLVLIILGVQVRRARAQRRGSRRSSDPFSEAVYEEIDYDLMRKVQLFGRSGSYSDESVRKLPYYTGDSEGENDAGSEQGSQLDSDNVKEPASSDTPRTAGGQEVPALPGGAPGDGYDDARETSDAEDDPDSRPSGQEVTGVHGDSDRARCSQTAWSLRSPRREGASEVKSDAPAPAPGDAGYDDVGDGVSGTAT
ncbi:scavenger receptor cysteine-rich type 1 protein M130-like isoform X1 [Pelodiscus sinensis]|uniref:scavenger receptor cysteine-rich type 1 protein M130-like isoform X1 n=1 Tax=Pelodiscus sinensis TaxID=13735 RepID=UPI003F6AD2D5